jgi:hypothetical protein
MDVRWATKDDLHGLADAEVDLCESDVLSAGMGHYLDDPTNNDPGGDHGNGTIQQSQS